MKIKHFSHFALSCLLLSSLFACTQGGAGGSDIPSGGDEPDNDPVEKTVEPITIEAPTNNSSFRLYDAAYDEYLNAEDENSAIKALLKYTKTNPSLNPVELSWKSNGSANYTVTLGNNEDLSDALIYKVSGITPYLNVYNLVPGKTYYWKVSGNSNGDASEVHSFKTENHTVRFINASGGANIRDLGGWTTEDGSRINYGLLYRGNCLNGYSNIATLTSDGIDTFNNELGIKSEIDLRTSGSDDLNQNSNWFNKDGLYLKATIGQYTALLDNTSWADLKTKSGGNQVSGSSASLSSRQSLKTIFETLSDINNYPIYMHCNVGADRTGSLAFLINGLLGVSYEQLVQDYELTSFSSKSGARYRSNIVSNNGIYSFDDSGVYPVSGNFIAFDAFYRAILNYYGTDGGTLSSAIENYLTSYIGISRLTIARIKSIMIDGYVDNEFNNLVSLNETQEIYLTDAKKSISLKNISLSSVSDIQFNGISLGTDINNLDMSHLKNVSGSGEIFVYGVLNGQNVVVQVPVNIVTEVITSLARFREIFKFKNSIVEGYYKLGSNIGGKDEVFNDDNYDSTTYGSPVSWSDSYGFIGTFDGNGYTIQGKSSYYGLFSIIGKGGVVKNVNIENYYYVSGQSKQHATFGLSIFGTIENVNLKIMDGPTRAIKTTSWHGLLCTSYVSGATFKNVTIDAGNYYIDSLFGGTNNGGFSKDTIAFENISLTCKAIDELGHYGNEKYSVMEVPNLKGSISYACEETNVIHRSSSTADIYLGSYFEAGYEIETLTYNGVSLEYQRFKDGEIRLSLGPWLKLVDNGTITLTMSLHSEAGLNVLLSVDVTVVD